MGEALVWVDGGVAQTPPRIGPLCHGHRAVVAGGIRTRVDWSKNSSPGAPGVRFHCVLTEIKSATETYALYPFELRLRRAGGA